MVEKMKSDYTKLIDEQNTLQSKLIQEQAKQASDLPVANTDGGGACLPPNDYGNNYDVYGSNDPCYAIYGHPLTNQLQAVVQNQQALLV